jgi:hypothetical protein
MRRRWPRDLAPRATLPDRRIVYSTCLFCHGSLGRNETLEAFPVGRRLAYDAARGRLWVVCRKCERWNLTPLEERWEAVEQAERVYRATRLRASTGEVGLARIAPPLGDGLELVRIGKPLRPEFAAWRYGDQFGRRRRRELAIAGGVAATGVALVAGGIATGLLLGGGAAVLYQVGAAAWNAARNGRQRALVARVPVPGGAGDMLHVERWHLRQTRFDDPGDDGPLALHLAHTRGTTRLTGRAAERAAARVLPAANRLLGARDDVRRAVQRIEAAGSGERFLAATARRAAALTRREPNAFDRLHVGTIEDPARLPTGLLALEPSLRLALEMALHEDDERRALEGELAALEAAWRGAESIAAIADDLALPDGVRARLARLRTHAAQSPPDGRA